MHQTRPLRRERSGTRPAKPVRAAVLRWCRRLDLRDLRTGRGTSFRRRPEIRFGPGSLLQHSTHNMAIAAAGARRAASKRRGPPLSSNADMARIERNKAKKKVSKPSAVKRSTADPGSSRRARCCRRSKRARSRRCSRRATSTARAAWTPRR